jgi:hypothetical protein
VSTPGLRGQVRKPANAHLRHNREMKSKPPKKPSPTEVAKAAGCSKGLASRLLTRGMTPEQIILRMEERRARELARLADAESAVNGRTNGAAMDFPTIPLPEEPRFPPFAESEKRKEFYLSKIRELQAQKLHGQLFPLEPLRSVVFTSTHFLSNRLRDLPDELADQLGAENAKLLRIRIHAIFDEARRVLAWECQRHGLPVPPDPPPPIRRRLAYYERFIRDSRAGEIETIPINERIDSPEWTRLHPSVTFEQGFEILRKKRQWDQDYLDLMRRRSEWDLPSELPDPPPPEPPEEPETV